MMKSTKHHKMPSAMGIFRRPDYQSEVTQFIEELKTKDPQLESKQRAGRALLWDKNVDRNAQVDYQEAQVAQKPYVYATDAK
jgi:Protein of unknown function (DUF3460)